MSLDNRPPYPHQRCYVIKLHRDSRPAEGLLCGLVEHVDSGHAVPFHSVAGLQAALIDHASGVQARVDASVSHAKE